MSDDTCEVYGWGLGPWGEDPWAAPEGFDPGGPIPSTPLYSLFCVGPCGPITVLDTYNEVEETYQAGQISATYPAGDDLRLSSGGLVSDLTGAITIEKSPPQSWTLEFSFSFNSLPDTFDSITTTHAYLGVCSSTSYSAGLFFAKSGIVYTGSVLHGVGGAVIPNHPLQLLPNSLSLVQENKYFTVRIALDGTTGTVYIYVTESASVPLTGHQLRFIVPAVPLSEALDTPIDGTIISWKGTAASPTVWDLNSICLGPGLLIPNLPPVADAGQDFTASRCSIVRLDASKSYDPEGAMLTYKWRLVDAPDASREVFVGDDGSSTTPTPLTNKFYSEQLGDEHAVDSFEVGDVLQLGDLFLDVLSIGTDGGGFFVTVTEYSIPAPLSGTSFKVLRQRGLAGATTETPTFLLDVPGVYRFSLVVSDGELFSLATDVVANSVESEVARGVTPNLDFMWSNLSNVWGLVEDKDVVTTLWSAMAQITSAELLTLWQHDQSKGLGGIPRLFQRKWLHYDLELKEPLPDLSTVGFVQNGVLSGLIPALGVNLQGLDVQVLSVAGELQRRVFFHGGVLLPAQIQDQLSKALGSSYTVTLFAEGADFRLRITHPNGLIIGENSSGLFAPGAATSPILGTAGAAVGLTSYRLDFSLEGTGVVAGDYLVVNRVAYRILSVQTDPADPSPAQRVLLERAVPTGSGSGWYIARPCTSKYLDMYRAMISYGDEAVVEVTNVASGESMLVRERVLDAPDGGTGSEVLVHLTQTIPYVLQPELFQVKLYGFVRKTYVPIDPLVREIPLLQDKIRDPAREEVLRQNLDYFIEEYRGAPCLRFVSGVSTAQSVWGTDPVPPRLWAEVTYIDNNPTIEAQYGVPVDFTLDDLAALPSNTDYLSVVRGLWFAYLNGPTLYNLRVGAQILLGLPFAEEAGTITAIEPRFSPTHGRILVTDTAPPSIVRAYTYPLGLQLETNPETSAPYAEGDSVSQFTPLVKGVEVVDYISNPTWWAPYQQQGVFFELEKFFKFLVRVDAEAFSLATLTFVRDFILRVKPTFAFPLFVVRRSVADATFQVQDQLSMKVRLNLFDGLCNTKGLGLIADDPNPAGGGLMAFADSGFPHTAQPTYPTPSTAVRAGADRNILCPTDYITATITTTFAVPTLPSSDSIFYANTPLYTDTLLDVGASNIIQFLPGAGEYLGLPVTSAGNYSLSTLHARFDSPASVVGPMPIRFVVEINGTDAAFATYSVPASSSSDYQVLSLSTTILVSPGDVIRIRLVSNTGSAQSVEYASLAVKLGAYLSWSPGVPVPAGTYKVTRAM